MDHDWHLALGRHDTFVKVVVGFSLPVTVGSRKMDGRWKMAVRDDRAPDRGVTAGHTAGLHAGWAPSMPSHSSLPPGLMHRVLHYRHSVTD